MNEILLFPYIKGLITVLNSSTAHIHVSAKVNIFTFQPLIYYILEKEISIAANSDIAKTKSEKKIIFVVERWIQCLTLRLKSQSAREAYRHPVLWATAKILVTRASFICQLYEWFFFFLV